MGDVFLSYAREDTERASLLAQALKRQGHSVWWDHKILSGKSFDKAIQQALERARCVIVLWSKYSVESDWVKDEASVGKDRDILVPVLIDDVDIPLGFRRVHTSDLGGWRGDGADPRLQQLFRSVAAMLGEEVDHSAYVHVRKDRRDRKSSDSAQGKSGKSSTSRTVVIGCAAAVVLTAVLAVGLFMGAGISNMDDTWQPETVPVEEVTGPTFETPPPSESAPPPLASIRRDVAAIYLRYAGDQYGGCALSLNWRIGGVAVAPTLNPQPVPGVPLGSVPYQVQGTIQCPMIGGCNAAGRGTVAIHSEATYDIFWENTTFGGCNVWLEQAVGGLH